MTQVKQAASKFLAYDAAIFAHDFRGAPAPDAAAFGYRHGWVEVDGVMLCREQAFPDQFFPRFPADQGLND